MSRWRGFGGGSSLPACVWSDSDSDRHSRALSFTEAYFLGRKLYCGRWTWRCRCHFLRCCRTRQHRYTPPKCFPSSSRSTTTISTRGPYDTGTSPSSTLQYTWCWYLPVDGIWQNVNGSSCGCRWQPGAACWPSSVSLVLSGPFPSWCMCCGCMVLRSLYAGDSFANFYIKWFKISLNAKR